MELRTVFNFLPPTSYSIGPAANTFDLILCSAVLHHVDYRVGCPFCAIV